MVVTMPFDCYIDDVKVFSSQFGVDTVAGKIDVISAEKTADIVLLSELRTPADVKPMRRFLERLGVAPSAKEKDPRKRRAAARQARHEARPPTQGYWAKRVRRLKAIEFTFVPLEPYTRKPLTEALVEEEPNVKVLSRPEHLRTTPPNMAKVTILRNRPVKDTTLELYLDGAVYLPGKAIYG